MICYDTIQHNTYSYISYTLSYDIYETAGRRSAGRGRADLLPIARRPAAGPHLITFDKVIHMYTLFVLIYMIMCVSLSLCIYIYIYIDMHMYHVHNAHETYDILCMQYIISPTMISNIPLNCRRAHASKPSGPKCVRRLSCRRTGDWANTYLGTDVDQLSYCFKHVWIQQNRGLGELFLSCCCNLSTPEPCPGPPLRGLRPDAGRRRPKGTLSRTRHTGLVSNSAPTWSSRCCFTACHF